jgi:hypothetical protein
MLTMQKLHILKWFHFDRLTCLTWFLNIKNGYPCQSLYWKTFSFVLIPKSCIGNSAGNYQNGCFTMSLTNLVTWTTLNMFFTSLMFHGFILLWSSLTISSFCKRNHSFWWYCSILTMQKLHILKWFLFNTFHWQTNLSNLIS